MPDGVTNLSSTEKAPEEAHFYLPEAKHLSISIFDTAPAYGSAEFLIGSSKLQFEIHTKLEKDMNLYCSLWALLARLVTESIDPLYVHDIEAFRLQLEAITVFLSYLLVVHIKVIGVCVYEIEDLELLLKYPSMTHVQLPMNLLD